MRSITNTRPSLLSQRADMLDTFILQNCASQASMKAWQSSIIHFADSNWNDGVQDIHFCCFFNPATQMVQFGSICNDGTELTLLAQDEWVINQQWNFYRQGLA